jgi:hypothetical protein
MQFAMTHRYVLVDTELALIMYGNDAVASRYDRLLGNATTVLAFTSVAELHRRARLCGWSGRRIAELDSYLRRYFVELTPIPDLSRIYGELAAHAPHLDSETLWTAANGVCYDVFLLPYSPDRYPDLPSLRLLQVGESAD